MRPLVETVNLKKYFSVRGGVARLLKGRVKYVPAVDDVNLKIYEGERVSLVGESGSGKTTLGRLLLRLITPTSGEIYFEGKNIMLLKGKELKEFRQKAQIIFQDPYTALDLRQTIRGALEEALIIHNLYSREERLETVIKALKSVGLVPPEFFLEKYPHELSGGQRQRAIIARALILNPKFLVFDEPLSLLDATTRVQILNMINEVKEKFNLTYLFITHDIALVRYISDKMFIMYQGKIMEAGLTEEILKDPLHPYTKTLMMAIPVPDPETKISLPPKVSVMDAYMTMSLQGCRFYSRCPYATQKCKVELPPLEEIEYNRFVACWNIAKS
ncbi:MAG: ABC transporter ATP-binding protein [Candidatus Bathyarchaeia archaeon]